MILLNFYHLKNVFLPGAFSSPAKYVSRITYFLTKSYFIDGISFNMLPDFLSSE